MSRRLTIVVCGAGPASDVDRLVHLAHDKDWEVQIIATPSALDFIDTDRLEILTGSVVRSEYRKPGEPRSAKSDAFIVAPATYNTINKLAAGMSDTYALGVLAEAIGMGLPVIILPFLNTALANREPFKRSVESLRSEGITVLLGPGQFEPHEPGTGDNQRDLYPWLSPIETLL